MFLPLSWSRSFMCDIISTFMRAMNTWLCWCGNHVRHHAFETCFQISFNFWQCLAGGHHLSRPIIRSLVLLFWSCFCLQVFDNYCFMIQVIMRFLCVISSVLSCELCVCDSCKAHVVIMLVFMRLSHAWMWFGYFDNVIQACILEVSN